MAAETIEHGRLPRLVGPYRLLQQIGRGGMGTVYLAERADGQFEKQVAVKMVQPGLDTEFILARFRRERQVLAHFDHPNIGRLLDGGTTADGIPYLVMEYIEGDWVTRHCDSQRLTIGQRLRLFIDICSAVHYAHLHFVVHRDLKPGNILVDSTGRPKLLDFGICKLLYRETQDPNGTGTVGMRMLTPEYASPEQVRGDPVTIASDIYSLGAVLYELLTGARPHLFPKLTPQVVEQVVCEQEIIPPSLAVKDRKLASRLRGDLDTIVLHAMKKEATRRYETVEQFAEDIRRHLSDRPILARTDTTSYRAAKFLRRNRVWVTVSVALIIAFLAGVRGEAWRESGVFRKARSATTRQSATAPVSGADRIAMLVKLGDSYAEENKWDEALLAYQQAFRQLPENPAKDDVKSSTWRGRIVEDIKRAQSAGRGSEKN
ncbi:MAG TPA: protein kinase [Terriglobales bacterium]